MSLPGLAARSTIVLISAVGRLSTTYQPRSSSTSAAPDRPAPDNPVISTISATPPTVTSRRCVRHDYGLFPEAEVEQPRERRCCRVLRCPGEESGRRRRFDHAFDDEPVLGERVDVARQRTVDEPDEHVEFDLLDRRRLDEVRPDPPVLLGRVDRVIVDPSGIRCLQDRMVEEEAEPPARPKHPSDLGDRFVDVVDVFEDEARDRRVERSVGERERRRTGAGVTSVRRPVPRRPETVPGRVDHRSPGSPAPQPAG